MLVGGVLARFRRVPRTVGLHRGYCRHVRRPRWISLAWQAIVHRSLPAPGRDSAEHEPGLLAADAVIATHAEVAAKLRGGDRAGEKGKEHPANQAEFAPYLALFE